MLGAVEDFKPNEKNSYVFYLTWSDLWSDHLKLKILVAGVRFVWDFVKCFQDAKPQL